MSNIKLSMTRVSTLALLVGLGMGANAYAVSTCVPPPVAQNPYAPLKPGATCQTVSADGGTTYAVTPEGQYPSVSAADFPPGSNMLPTKFTNHRDPRGEEIINTVPYTPTNPYNLHDGPVTVSDINKTSPTKDLKAIVDKLMAYRTPNTDDAMPSIKGKLQYVQRAIDILEGNPVADRAYSGISMLHYTGPLKYKKVVPIFDANGVKVGGNIDVNMFYFDQHIESDTFLLDPSDVLEVPWTISYHINILDHGVEDFAPAAIFFDEPLTSIPAGDIAGAGVSMDQTFFPMLMEGKRYNIKIKEPPGKRYSLTYHWGWRMHPPRVQVIENATKTVAGKTLLQWETDTFGVNPRANEAAKLAAIDMLGELDPGKRMWKALRAMRDLINANKVNDKSIPDLVNEFRLSYLDWTDRKKLPRGVTADPDADMTLFYVGNTIYGSRRGTTGEGANQGSNGWFGTQSAFLLDWHKRPYTLKTRLYNGDKFLHAYVAVDFGSSRGWENQFQNTDPTTLIDANTGEPLFPVDRGGTDEHLEANPRKGGLNGPPLLGSGPFFTFGRMYWWIAASGPWGVIAVGPAAADGTPATHKVELTFNYEPSMRLRIYQGDAIHHDVAVYSLH